MNWIERQGIFFSGEYRVYRTSRGEYDVWRYSHAQNGCVKRGFATLPAAQKFSEQHEAKENSLLKSLDAVHVK